MHPFSEKHFAELSVCGCLSLLNNFWRICWGLVVFPAGLAGRLAYLLVLARIYLPVVESSLLPLAASEMFAARLTHCWLLVSAFGRRCC